MSRAVRAIAIIAIVLGWELNPVMTQRVAAVDCSQVFCGTLEIVPSNGAGSGRVTSDPGGIDCTWTPSGRSGTCAYQFSWPHFVTTGIDVDLYLDPDGHSYVCQGLTCGGLDQTLHRVEHLNPGDNFDVFMVFNLGNKTTVSVRPTGTGAGRVTTVPAGLNCRWASGVRSGTCDYDYWYIGGSSSIALHRTPDQGSYACSGGAPFCGTPSADYVGNVNISPGGSGPPADFWLAVPITVNVTGSGTVVSDPAGISCGAVCSKWFAPDWQPDDFTTLTATPLSGWFVKDWTGACNTATGSTCQFFNGYSGATVGVVFARNSTPAPSAPPTPRPTATAKPTPKPTATSRPSAAPTSAALASPAVPAATSGPSFEPSVAPTIPEASIGPAATLGSPAPGVSQVAVLPSGAGVEPSDAATRAPFPGGSAASGSIDPTVLILLFIIATLTLVLGFLLGRRRVTPKAPTG